MEWMTMNTHTRTHWDLLDWMEIDNRVFIQLLYIYMYRSHSFGCSVVWCISTTINNVIISMCLWSQAKHIGLLSFRCSHSKLAHAHSFLSTFRHLLLSLLNIQWKFSESCIFFCVRFGIYTYHVSEYHLSITANYIWSRTLNEWFNLKVSKRGTAERFSQLSSFGVELCWENIYLTLIG